MSDRRSSMAEDIKIMAGLVQEQKGDEQTVALAAWVRKYELPIGAGLIALKETQALVELNRIMEGTPK